MISPSASPMRSRSQAPRSCSASRTSPPPASGRVARRASCTRSSASRPATSRSRGSSRSMRARSSARAVRSSRTSAAPDGAAWPVVYVRWMTESTASSRAGSSSGAGTAYGMPAAAILCLARVMRAAIAVSDTRNAWDTSGVATPHTSRSRSSGIAGSSMSSGSASAGSSSSGSFASSVRRRRTRFSARRRATVVSQAPGRSGTPSHTACGLAGSSHSQRTSNSLNISASLVDASTAPTREARRNRQPLRAGSRVTAADDLRRLEVAAGVEVHGQPHELGVRPGERRRRGRARAGREAGLARRRVLVPHLLGQQVPAASAALAMSRSPRWPPWSGRRPARTRRARRPAAARPGRCVAKLVRVAHVPRRAVALLAVAVERVAVPERAVRASTPRACGRSPAASSGRRGRSRGARRAAPGRGSSDRPPPAGRWRTGRRRRASTSCPRSGRRPWSGAGSTGCRRAARSSVTVQPFTWDCQSSAVALPAGGVARVAVRAARGRPRTRGRRSRRRSWPASSPSWFSQRSCGVRGPLADQEVGRPPDVAKVAASRAAELPGQHDRERDLVQLQARPSAACRRPASSGGTSRRASAGCRRGSRAPGWPRPCRRRR